jgi:cell division protein FtsB
MRHGQGGRPVVPKQIRDLIREMSRGNPHWGAPRIHGELLKLGIDIGRGEAQIRELEESIEALKLRKAALLDPGRIEKIARDALGLVEPKDEDIVYRKQGQPR